MDLTSDRARELLRYEPNTGLFYWAVSRRCVRAGDLAGTRHATGYNQICVDGKLYRGHRLAWLWMVGEFPCCEIDHIDGNRTNDRWVNLRSATRAQNMRNSRARVSAKGASFDPKNNKWVAQIKVGGKTKHIGRFLTEQDAHDAYVAAAKIHFNEFARAK